MRTVTTSWRRLRLAVRRSTAPAIILAAIMIYLEQR